MMGLWDLLTNTAEGVAQVAVNTVKAPIAPIVDGLTDGDVTGDAIDGIEDGMAKIGDTSPRSE